MTLLGLFNGPASSVSIPLSLVAALLIGIFLFQAIRKAKVKGGVTQTPTGNVFDDLPNKLMKQPETYFAFAVLVCWIFAMIMVSSDYRGPKKKDGVPKVQTDTTRQAAEDFNK